MIDAIAKIKATIIKVNWGHLHRLTSEWWPEQNQSRKEEKKATFSFTFPDFYFSFGWLICILSFCITISFPLLSSQTNDFIL